MCSSLLTSIIKSPLVHLGVKQRIKILQPQKNHHVFGVLVITLTNTYRKEKC
jgi:hypothetical protein